METLSYVELMERHLAVVAENVGMKEFIYNDCMVYKDFMGELDDADKHKPETPATDRIVAAQRSAFVDEAVAKITESGALTFGDCIVALCQLREGTK